PLTGALMRSIGIARTFQVIGAAALVLLTALSRLIANPPKGYRALRVTPAADTDGTTVRAEPVAAAGPDDMLRTGNFYKMWVMFALSSAASTMIISLAATIAKVQAGWEGGLVLVILLAVFNAAGRTLGGMLSDRIGRPWTMRLAFALLAANMLLFSLYTSPPLLMIGAAVTGLCYGTGMVVFSASTADLYGLKSFGANYGLVYTAWGAGAVLALNGAVLYDTTKSFHAGYLAAAGLALCALVISLTFRMRGSSARASGGARPLA
ncbi:MAG TPA: MFS transporter, partial [Spirochaetia bacterium]